MKFEMHVELGNDGMKSNTDLAAALATVTDAVSAVSTIGVSVSGNIRDVNGNTVGKWRLAEPRKYTKKAGDK